MNVAVFLKVGDNVGVNTVVNDVADNHFAVVDIDAGGVVERTAFDGSDLLQDGVKPLGLALCGDISAVEAFGNGGGVEAHHVHARHVGMDIDVGQGEVVVEGVFAHQCDALHEEVGHSTDFGIGAGLTEVNADDVVGSHGACHIGGEVVAGAAVDVDASILTDGREEEGDGHGGAHGIGQMSVCPVFGFHRDQVGGYAAVGDGQVAEVHRVLVAHREAVDGVVDIVAVDVAVGEVGYEVGGVNLSHLGGGEGIGGLVGLAGDIVFALPAFPFLALVAEGGADEVGLVVFAPHVRHLVDGHLVAEHHAPVGGCEDGVDFFAGVAHGHQSAYQTAHAGAEHHVDGNAQLFDILEGTHMGCPLGTSAGQHKGHSGTVASDGVHLVLHAGDCGGIGCGVDTGRGKMDWNGFLVSLGAGFATLGVLGIGTAGNQHGK